MKLALVTPDRECASCRAHYAWLEQSICHVCGCEWSNSLMTKPGHPTTAAPLGAEPPPVVQLVPAGTPLHPPDGNDGTPPAIDLVMALASIVGGVAICIAQGWHGLVPLGVGLALGWRFVRWARWWWRYRAVARGRL